MRRRRGWVLLAALIAAAVTARMGFWQLDRADQKLSLQASIARQALALPLLPEEFPHDETSLAGQIYRQADVAGVWVPRSTVFLDNRQMSGRPGFFVVTLLQLPQGDAIPVQRGWIPRDMADRTRLPTLALPSGNVRVHGRIAPWPSHLTQLGDDAPGMIRQNLDRTAWSNETGLSLRPFSLAQLNVPGVNPDGLLRDWPMPAVDVQKHHGYAAQWFTFSAMIAGLYVWFQIVKPRRRRDLSGGSDGVDRS